MKTGIYLIQNIKNGKCYVGQSKDIDKRIKEHKNAMCYKNENSKFNEDLKILRKNGIMDKKAR